MRYLASWVLYGLGDLVYRLAGPRGFWPIYNHLMLWSDDIQGESRGPWIDLEEPDLDQSWGR